MRSDICERGYDPDHWFRHPAVVEDGVDPFINGDDPGRWPSYRMVRAIIQLRAEGGERAWAYSELVEHAQIHEAKVTNGITAMVDAGELVGPHVVFCDPGPNAQMQRDYIVHTFCLPGTDDEQTSAKTAVLNRLESRGLLKFYMEAAVRIGVSRSQRAAVWATTDGHCWYCGAKTNPFIDFRVDHYVAVARGGQTEEDNLVPACHPCNAAKSAMSVEQFRVKRGGETFWFEREGKTL